MNRYIVQTLDRDMIRYFRNNGYFYSTITADSPFARYDVNWWVSGIDNPIIHCRIQCTEEDLILLRLRFPILSAIIHNGP